MVEKVLYWEVDICGEADLQGQWYFLFKNDYEICQTHGEV